MSATSSLVTAEHLERKAVIYIRQSTASQVLNNAESRKLQHAMREHARRLGWLDDRIDIVENDTGQSGASVNGRGGYKQLLSDVAVGDVGIVLSYESTRLSRNCSDWYPLLDLCALRGVLIADRDGVYDPKTVNGRMLLGMKGILSEMELHTLRGRLQAGFLNKGAIPSSRRPGGARRDLAFADRSQERGCMRMTCVISLRHGTVRGPGRRSRGDIPSAAG